MKSLINILFVFLYFYQVNSQIGVNTKINVSELRCLVCRASLDELLKKVSELDPTKTVDIGGFRLDADGNYKTKTVTEDKSEVRLSELIDNICKKMEDYVRVLWKSNGTLDILKMVNDEGKMNIEMSEVDFVQDDDLNKSLAYYCEEIMEENEENIIKHIQNDENDLRHKLCVEDAQICPVPQNKDEL